jgi:hypothetical protein
MLSGKREAGLRGNAQRGQTRDPQIVVQRADRRACYHVAGTGHGKSGHRQAACESFQENQAKGVGLARKHEYVGGRIGLRQFFALPRPEKHGLRIFSGQRYQRRSITDNHLGARQIEIEKCIEILFNRNAADAQDVFVLGKRGAALHPVAAVHINDTMLVANGGVMDVAADHAFGTVTPRLGCKRPFEGADIIHGVLDLQLRPLRQRPIGHAEPSPEHIDEAIHPDREIVGLVAEMREPARVLHHEVEDVAVNHEIAPPVDADMDGIFHDVDAAEMRAVIVSEELVVIARHVDDLGALARLAQHFLHEVVMRLRPIPVGLQRPAIDDIADEIDGVGVMAAEKVQQSFGLRTTGSEMDVGDKQSAKAPFRTLVTHNVTSHARAANRMP